MLTKLITAVAAALALMLATAAGAGAATTPNFAFKHGEANYRTAPSTVPGAYQQGVTPRQPCPVSGDPACTYEAHEFTIGPNEANGAFAVTITWESADDDWDLFVYKVRSDGTVDESDPVASSAQGGTTDETATLPAGPDTPIPAGKYRIYVDNWAVAASQDWEGHVSFAPFVAGNRLPSASIAAASGATAGAPVTLDGSRSGDPDGTLVNYAWDLDGDGAFETDAGASSTFTAAFPAGRANIGLRVTDNRGGVAYASRSFTVGPAAAGGAAPSTATTPAPGRIGLDLRARQKRSTILRRGLAATVECPAACSIVSQLTVNRATARRLDLGSSRLIARQARRLRNRGFARVRVRPSTAVARSGLRRVRSVPATLRVSVRAADGTQQTFTRVVTIVR